MKKYNTNANTEHSKKLRAATAAKANAAKLASGEYKQLSLRGRAEDMAPVLAAMERAGGSKVQALKRICAEWLAGQD